METNNIEEYILKIIRENASQQNISLSSNIKEDVGIDSIGWLKCLIQLEVEYGCVFNPQLVFANEIVYVQDFINRITEYIENSRNAE